MATLTAVLGVVALLDRTWVTALQQDPARFHEGDWWRLLTPLVVQGNGWGQYAFNVLGVVLVGVAVERELGTARWLAVYLGGGMVEVAVSMWAFPERLDSGASAAVAALIGAMTVQLWRTRRLPPWPAFGYAGVFACHLAMAALAGTVAGVVGGLVAAVGLGWAARVLAPGRLRLVVSVVVGLPLLALALRFDSHGVGWVAGMLLTIALVGSGDRPRGDRLRPDRLRPDRLRPDRLRGDWPDRAGSPRRTSPTAAPAWRGRHPW